MRFLIFGIMWFIFVALFGSAMLFGNWGMMQIHEEAHVTIYKYHGIESRSDVGVLYGYTYANATQYEEKCDDVCKLSQNMIDGIGYQISGAIAVMWVMVGMLIIYFTFFFPTFQKS
jgi:hypothetical protein